MNRWNLLKHETNKNKIFGFHYDFLLENGNNCLTWKLLILPKLDGKAVDIYEHNNHRLIWLSKKSQTLTKNRGFVTRIDNGTYQLLDNKLSKDNFSLILDGKKLKGLFIKDGNFCQLQSFDK